MTHTDTQLLGTVVDQTASLVWSTDASLRVTHVRRSAFRISGIDVQQVVKRTSSAHERALAGTTTDLDYESDERLYEVHVRPLVNEEGTIVGCLGVAHDATSRRHAERALAWHLGHDALTNLPNRTQLREVLAARIRDTRRRNGTLGLLVVDIDAFHAINDAAGWDAGDAVLCEVAARIERAIAGRHGYMARIGDVQFAVIVEEWPMRTATSISEAMAPPFVFGTTEALVTASVGIAELPAEDDSPDHLLRAASAAVRRARELGGNQYQTASAALTLAAGERLGLESRLRTAIARGELSLAFQPQVRLHDGVLLSVEALLRWTCNGELVPAASFIHAVEDSPIIIEIGEWVMNEACRQVRAWRDAGIAPPRLALNIGARHFQHASFFASLRRAMERHGIEGGAIEIEITETTAMHNGEASARLIDELRTLGVEITIDDFGTGYSSLAYLKRFAITGVKIDRSFLHDLPSRSASAIVNAIIATAHALGLRVVAEGVEDSEQAILLEAAGCEEGQGYWFARPMTAAAFVEYLQIPTAASRPRL